MGMTNEQKVKLAAKFMMEGLEQPAADRAADIVCAFRAVRALQPMTDEAAALIAMACVR